MKEVWTPKHSPVPTRLKGVLQEGVPETDLHVGILLGSILGIIAWRKGSKHKWIEKLNCNTVTIKALADLSGSSGARIVQLS